jgi:membrane-associated protease RseP (regulator of RpoE activity)
LDQPQNAGQHDPLKPRNPQNGNGDDHVPVPETPAGAGEAEAPPMTPMAWLVNNGVYIVLVFAAVIALYRNTGLDGLWRAFLVIIGLSFVVFIHELGHFLAAKWCDVHVTTFSLGFGPALPGCSWQRGETTYKIALLPLGGYVAMVGEGPEADEDENYPRSFKNKSVGARMLIISAGVIMNVLLGAACFIFVFMTHGHVQTVARVGGVEPGSPAWKAGVRDGWAIEEVEGIKRPFFDQMRIEVLTSSGGHELQFVFLPHGGGELIEKRIEPRRDASDNAPVLGVMPSIRLRLWPARQQRDREAPVYYTSAAAFARSGDFRPGDTLVDAQVAEQEPVTLKAGSAGVTQLCQLFREHWKQPITVHVRRQGAKDGETVSIKTEPNGFRFDDEIISTTDPATPDETFKVVDLLPAPASPNDKLDDKKEQEDAETLAKKPRDPMDYRQRMRLLAGKPVAIGVRNGDETRVVLVPPAFTWVLQGLRMKMGEVAAVRDGSPASKVKFTANGASTKGDVITRVEAIRTDRKGKETRIVLQNVKAPEVPAPADVKELNPLRLPFDLASFANAAERDPATKVRVKITVARLDKERHTDRLVPLDEMEWDDSWNDQFDLPVATVAPMAIPQLGLAYRIESIVDAVAPGSDADKAELKENDRVEAITFQLGGKLRSDVNPDDPKWGKASSLETKRFSGQSAFDAWASVGTELQRLDAPKVKLKVRRDDKELEKELPISAVEDTTWPADNRGLLFTVDTRIQKEDTLVGAVAAGTSETWRFIRMMYLNLKSLFTGRISTNTLGGPIEIAAQTFSMAEDPYVLILWLGMISINLAVVNFLPIPILDGGHMVFLTYELFRGRPPSQAVQAAATYVGLFLILSLMIFVLYIDLRRRVFGIF